MGDIGAEKKPPAVQARPLLSIIPNTKTKSQKKVSSLIQTSCAHTSCNPPSCFGNQSGLTSYTPCPNCEVVSVYAAQVPGGSHSSKQPRIPWAEHLKSSDQHSGAQPPHQTSCMSPPLSKIASRLSDRQLFHQVALILEAMSAGMSNRKGPLPLKLPGSQPVGTPRSSCSSCGGSCSS